MWPTIYRLATSAQEAQTAGALIASLTEREREVMVLLVAELGNKEIADRLGISHRTVEIHKARVMHKTEARTLLELIRLAAINGLSG